MLDLACEHARTRVQFDRTISGFQAVRHKLAETLVAIEAADGAAAAAWDDGSPFAAMAAKAVAGRSAKVVVRHCQQVLAGIGFTIEHPFHGYVRRALLLDHLLGSSPKLTHEVGERLIERRRVPAMVAL
jgi:alkylation response protein AidB-like acyl-CoA dehydrogenase